jgi:hypothetical protein
MKMPLVNLEDNPELFANISKYCKEKDGTEFLIRDDNDWNFWSERWKEVKEDLDFVKRKEQEIRDQLIKICQSKNCQGCGVKVQKIIRKGSVRYDQIDELKGVDLEQYRDMPSESWRVTCEEKYKG